MGSKTYEGVRFSVFSDDHWPAHVHGEASGVSVIVDLLPGGEVDIADRRNPILPPNAKRNTVAKILRVAAENVDDLVRLWEGTHGTR